LIDNIGTTKTKSSLAKGHIGKAMIFGFKTSKVSKRFNINILL